MKVWKDIRLTIHPTHKILYISSLKHYVSHFYAQTLKRFTPLYMIVQRIFDILKSILEAELGLESRFAD